MDHEPRLSVDLVHPKVDLAGPDGVAKARAVIAAKSARPLPVIDLTDGISGPRAILRLNAAAENDLASGPLHHDG